MTIYRNVKDGKLYKLFVVSPRHYTGSWYEAEALFGGVVRKLNNSSFRLADFKAVANS